MIISYLCIVFLQLLRIVIADVNRDQDETYRQELAIRNDLKDALVLFTTIDGSMYAIEKSTGEIRWKNEGLPAVEVPSEPSENVIPIVITDPKTGELYMLDATENNGDNYIKKLPLTIHELVLSSSCFSADQSLWSVERLGSWFWLDRNTGRKRTLGEKAAACETGKESSKKPSKASSSVPATEKTDVDIDIDENDIDDNGDGDDARVPDDDGAKRANDDGDYVSSTKYVVSMNDPANPIRHWNVSVRWFNSVPASQKILDLYEYSHFSSNRNGQLRTFNKKTGSLVWSVDLESPILNAYILFQNRLNNVPLLTVSDLNFLSLDEFHKIQKSFIEALYIGEHKHGLYAMKTLYRQSELNTEISETDSILIQSDFRKFASKSVYVSLKNIWSNRCYANKSGPENDMERENRLLLLGYYYLPKVSLKFMPASSYEPVEIPNQINALLANRKSTNFIDYQTEKTAPETSDDNKSSTNTTNDSRPIPVLLNAHFMYLFVTPLTIPICLLLLWNIYRKYRLKIDVHVKQRETDASGTSSSSGNSTGSNGYGYRTDKKTGLVHVGKISYDEKIILGKGCNGTVVYKGQFDKRPVAVKRLLIAYCNVAEREANLLRESDSDPNVIRYFCTEEDFHFQYIAIELCNGTVDDFIADPDEWNDKIDPVTLIKQASDGLKFLHSKKIVHRDIKPQNVLLAKSIDSNTVRVVISDFGMCKKLQSGRDAFSQTSGVLGTEGWTAPEISTGRLITKAVDIFSLGCLYYYVLTNGRHPFGEKEMRQTNIAKAASPELDALSHWNHLHVKAKSLICKMIADRAEDRPGIETVVKYPLFWDTTTELQFLQDVSDRIDKLDDRNNLVQKIDTDSFPVIRCDWKQFVNNTILLELLQRRTYNGCYVRDLLRALRNKRSHYEELDEESRKLLGPIPHGFLGYWTNLFPLLITHVWQAVQQIRHESIFTKYYHNGGGEHAPNGEYEFNSMQLVYKNYRDELRTKSGDYRKIETILETCSDTLKHYRTGCDDDDNWRERGPIDILKIANESVPRPRPFTAGRNFRSGPRPSRNDSTSMSPGTYRRRPRNETNHRPLADMALAAIGDDEALDVPNEPELEVQAEQPRPDGPEEQQQQQQLRNQERLIPVHELGRRLSNSKRGGRGRGGRGGGRGGNRAVAANNGEQPPASPPQPSPPQPPASP